jgi:hypothetical protein
MPMSDGKNMAVGYNAGNMIILREKDFILEDRECK